MNSLFLIRHYNDFDWMAPVIDGWVRLSPEHRALVYFTHPAVAWSGDFRTVLLSETGRVEFADIWQTAGIKPGGVLARQWRANRPNRRLHRKALQLATELAVTPYFPARFAKLLDRFQPQIVAFDHYDVPRNRKFLGMFGYQETLAWRNLHGCPLVALPHGLLLFSEPGEIKKRFSTNYDLIFVESERRNRFFSDTIHDKIVVSGSARYDPSWVDRIVRALDKPVLPGSINSDATRIVFFATKPKRYFNFRSLLDWLEHLAGHPGVELVVQPHPRGQKASAFSRIANIPNVTIDPDTPASRLIDEADMVSTLVSSVVVEAAIRNREILYPKFLNTTATRFEKAGACVALARSDDTHAAIDGFRAGVRVPRKQYDEFLDQDVFGGNDRQTIARVCKRMERLAKSHRR